jgi:hypothetical protein
MSIDWDTLARGYAREAHEKEFSTRWGVWISELPPALVVFSNHFYRAGATLQDREREYLRDRFAAVGIGVLGEATWPVSGPDDGYSYAMVLDADGEREPLVASILDEAIDVSLRRASGESPEDGQGG